MAMTDKAFFTVDQVAAALQVHPSTVRVWLRRGIVKGTKLGKVWRIAETELERIRAGTK